MRQNSLLSLATLFFAVILAAGGQLQDSSNATNPINNGTNTTVTMLSNTTGTQLGQLLLQEMHQEDRLTTPFSQRDTVIYMPLPRSEPSPHWRPCVVATMLQHRTTIQILVLGGSSASRPGNGCDTPTDPWAGRYSNLLQQQLNQRVTPYSYEFRVTNRAQGAETSDLSALMFDARIDTTTTDLIVWDYSINDHSNHPEELRKLRFWLTRLAVQFEKNQQRPRQSPPPPILLLYLWEHRAGNKLQRGYIDTLDHDPMSYMGSLVEEYRALGWEIAVVNVGGAVNSTFLKQGSNIWLFLDDPGHPGCRGTQFIADLMEHTLWSNLASPCDNMNTTSHLDENNDTHGGVNNPLDGILPPHNTTVWPNHSLHYKDLWEDLFDSEATIGSISPWQPSIPGHSNMNYTLNFNESSWPLEVLPMHTERTREDRKYGYRLPRCSEQELGITLHEPNLQWIGLGVTGTPLENEIRFQINNQTVPLQDFAIDGKWTYGRSFLSHWMEVADPAEDSFSISFCHQSTLSDEELRQRDGGDMLANLQLLIAVTVPPNRTRH
jgi:hypothetical protein